MHTEAYFTHIRLQKELDKLTAKNLGYSPAAQKVKKLMYELWRDLSESEKYEIYAEMPVRIRFWNNVEKKLREWGYANPSEVLQSLHPFGTDETLEEIIARKRNRTGDDAAMKLLERLINRMTGGMG